MIRLLKANDGTFSLDTFSEPTIPPYAILSHTWGSDSEEVTFKDIADRTGSDKAGYQKLRFCENQAKAHGLRHFWVDTCCIDKSNEKELTTAINSMFRWYQNAARCYVYLSDVSVRTQDGLVPHIEWESSFRISRWFTRGWTLQELLAPKIVEFYSRDHVLLGDRTSLERQIHEITEIAIEALRGRHLQDFNVQERFKWCEKRQTTKGEDMAYCLLGIFDVFMPLIYAEGQTNAMRRLRREIKDSKSEEYESQTLNKKPLWIVPFERNRLFISRETELSKLEELLFEDGQYTKVAITGLGGVGKTALLLELLFRTKNKHPNCSIIWIPATNLESLHQAYLEVAQQLDISGWEDDKEDVKRLVQEYLCKESTGRWLLVFDNADDIYMWIAKVSGSEPGLQDRQGFRPLIDYLPKSKQGAIVFTTRDRKIAVKLAQQNVVNVPAMGEDAATRLLEKCLVNPDLINSQQDTNTLLSQLTYLPLAIVQAAAYINENGTTLEDYVLLLGDQEEEVIELLSEEFEDDGRYRDVKNPVATTWLISFEQIQQRDPLAADYLSFMACVEPKDIPQSLLPLGVSRKREIDAIGTLTAYSFINRRPGDTALDLHRLVHVAMRNWLRKEMQLAQSTKKAIVRLEDVFPDDSHENRSLWRTYLPHVRCALESNTVNKDWEPRMNLLARYGSCLYKDGRWDEAEKIYVQVMEIWKGKFGANHSSTLTSMINLAEIYRNQGRLDEAEKLGLQVIEIEKKILGADHLSTLISMTNLAAIYSEQGQQDKAEKLEVQVIEIQKKNLGVNHDSILISMANLAAMYRNQGRLDEAEKLSMQVIEMKKKKFGVDHPFTLTSMANLAVIYSQQGQQDKAEKLNVQVIEIKKKKFGVEHPSTLNSMTNLAVTYSQQGQQDKAEKLKVQVVEIQKEKLGIDHPFTLTSMANLAVTYSQQGQQDKAEKLKVQVIEIQKKKLGVNHPSTLTSMGNLAVIYSRQGQQDKAEKFKVQVMEIQKEKLGVNLLWDEGKECI